MALGTTTVEIKSDAGEVWRYDFVAMPAGKGVKIFRRLAKIIPAALSGLADAAPTTPNAAPTTPNAKDELSGEDVDKLGGAIQGIVDVIGEAGDAKFFKEILVGATRTNPETLKGSIVATDFDAVYQANYGELVFALYHAIKVNFGPAIERMLGKSKLVNLKPLITRLS